MFKRLSRWFRKTLEPEAVEVSWPEDVWERMRAMALAAEKLQLGELSVFHFDVLVEVTTANIHQLFRRIEVVINCIDIQDDPPEWWSQRNRDKQPKSLADFYFDKRNGYHHPQDVLTKLIEKALVIHHLIESQQINVNHNYYSYMRREFYQIVSDIVEVLTASIELGKQSN